MKSTLRRIGNSKGLILPQPLLAQVGLVRDVELTLEQDAIVIRRPKRRRRTGWADASKAIAAVGDDKLVWPEFANRDDGKLRW